MAEEKISPLEGKIPGIYFMDNEFMDNPIPIQRTDKGELIKVDVWDPKEDDILVTCVPGFFIAPISVYSGVEVDPSSKFDWFMLTSKKCYNSVSMRHHLFQYINYFCRFYDEDKEYLSILFVMKIKTERYTTTQYPPDIFFYDLERYILKSNIANKVDKMVADNYSQDLNYTNIKSPSLQYTNAHAILLHKMSILMDLCIPLLTNYAYMHKIDNINDYLLTFYDRVLHIDDSIDMYLKLYDTAYTNILSNQKNNQGIWIKQDIRAIDVTTHSTDSVHNIILNIMPKYTFDKNIVSFNYASIRKNTAFKVTDISFEFSYVPVSSSKRDGDSVSDFDRYEMQLVKQSEALYLQNKINCDQVMKTIESMFGPFDPKEIALYTDAILKDEYGNIIINGFQKQLVFSLFYKYFRDTQSIYAINKRQYIELVIAAKKILKANNMLVLPYIVSGKIEKLVSRKTVNKKEKAFVESSPTYPLLLEKYKDEDIISQILSIVATIISSDFSIVDMDPSINGKVLDTLATNVIVEEVEAYILMC